MPSANVEDRQRVGTLIIMVEAEFITRKRTAGTEVVPRAGKGGIISRRKYEASLAIRSSKRVMWDVGRPTKG